MSVEAIESREALCSITTLPQGNQRRSQTRRYNLFFPTSVVIYYGAMRSDLSSAFLLAIRPPFL